MFTKIEIALMFFLFGTAAAQSKLKVSYASFQDQAPGKVIRKGKLLYTEVEIQAPAEKVWSILMDFQKYPEWNPFIKEISGAPVVGQQIKAHIVPPGNKGMVFTPIVLVNETNKEFRWIGKLGISRIFDGEHTFAIVDHGNGTCTFRQYERFRGILVPFFSKMLDKNSKEGFELMNQKLKERAEK